MADETKSRWPLAPQWAAVQQATLWDNAIGLDRVRAGIRKGSIRRLTPALVGYLASAAALLGADDLGSTMPAVRWLVERDQRIRGVDFVDRIAERRARELGL